MSLKMKTVILAIAVVGAAVSAACAFGSIRKPDLELPEEILARFHIGSDEGYLCYVRPYNGYLAVFSDRHSDKPEHITDIELSSLRSTDISLAEKAIPARSRDELLELLEDLGS